MGRPSTFDASRVMPSGMGGVGGGVAGGNDGGGGGGGGTTALPCSDFVVSFPVEEVDDTEEEMTSPRRKGGEGE